MKLYLTPGACSLASHIALHEGDVAFDAVKVDLKAKRTDDGREYLDVNPKGYVPALEFDDGEVLTENIAILSWISDRADLAGPAGELARHRLLETLAFISTELHKKFAPFFDPSATQMEKDRAAQVIGRRLRFLAAQMNDDYLYGPDLSVADAYLFVMLTWAKKFGLTIPEPLELFFNRMADRPAVRMALEHEWLEDETAGASRSHATFEPRTNGH
jgi:glutathione S-transferase